MSNGGKRLQQQDRRQPQRRPRRKAKPPLLLIFAAIAVVLALAVLIWALTRGGAAPSEPGDTSVSSAQPVQSTPPGGDEEPPAPTGLSFPYALENGGLTVGSLFQSTIFNPDCGGASGEDIASLEFTNSSGRYLVRCEFTAVTVDGAEYHFLARDIPAGQTVDAFETSNASLDSNVKWASITCTADFEDAVYTPAGLDIRVEDTQVTLTNNGSESLTNYVVHCHCSLDGNYFGGTTYSYPIETLAAGETITVSADDCYLGEAAVVRVVPADAG